VECKIKFMYINVVCIHTCSIHKCSIHIYIGIVDYIHVCSIHLSSMHLPIYILYTYLKDEYMSVFIYNNIDPS
jgi:hypothetical protein